MATDKRARQRANREAKLAEERKRQRRATILRRARRIAVWVAIAVLAIFLVNALNSGSTDDAAGVLLLI